MTKGNQAGCDARYQDTFDIGGHSLGAAYRFDSEAFCRLCADRGITTRAIALAIGMNIESIRSYRQGRREPSRPVVTVLSQVLDCEPDDLVVPVDDGHERIRALVDAAPPLTPRQQSQIAAIIAGVDPPQRERARSSYSRPDHDIAIPDVSPESVRRGGDATTAL
jgi:transcriptional regulator with XRE-family HTH domain